jgi:thiamine transport system substrate-binding protein
MRCIVCFIVLLVAPSLSAVAAETPEIVLYTTPTFATPGGFVPTIQKAFEADCGCRLTVVVLADGRALLDRLRQNGPGGPADVVLGIDLNRIDADYGLLGSHGRELFDLQLPVAWNDPVLVPVAYTHLAFVHAPPLPAAPASLQALSSSRPPRRVLIQDPHTSTAGLELVLWLRHAYGEQAAAIWKRLQPRIDGIAATEEEARAVLRKGTADLVLAYSTTPAALRRGKSAPATALFLEGHYLHLEVAARLAQARRPELARRFLAFLLSPEVQKLIPTQLTMYPVRTPAEGLPAEWATLPRPAKTLIFEPTQVWAQREQWLQEWREALAIEASPPTPPPPPAR